MKYFILAICLLVSLTQVQAQREKKIDGFIMELKKVKVNPKPLQAVSYNLHASDSFKKVMLRLRVKSLTEKPETFDPNKFFAVDEVAKKRIRPSDTRYNHILHEYLSFGFLAPSEVENPMVGYDPSIKDTFSDYRMEGYTDVEHKVNVGSLDAPEKSIIYFKTQPVKSNLIDVYFVVKKQVGQLKFYYGDTVLLDAKIK
jgi:hypothetical protein